MEEQRTELYYGEGSSNKGYNASLIEISEGKWNVKIAYGRAIGILPDMGYKLKEHVGYYEAATVYEKLIQAKQKKGYQITYQS